MNLLKQMSDEQLQAEYKSINISVNIVGCFSVKDIIYLEQLETELRKRGYQIQADVVFVKA